MDPGSNQIKKVRTFHTDMERVRPGEKPTPEETPVVSKPPTPNLPPVMTPRKPETVVQAPPVPKVPTPAPIPPPTKQVVGTDPASPLLPKAPTINLNDQVQKELGHITAKAAFDPNERINVMDADSDVVEGTIITDQKRERFKLLPAMAEAVKGWLEEGKVVVEERAEAKRKATPTVTAIENRKKVLQKAAVKSALAPKDDHQKLAAKLPTSINEREAKAKQAVVIKKKNPEAKPGWSHFEGVAEVPKEKVPEPKPITEEEILTTVAPPVLPPPPKAIVPLPPKATVTPLPPSIKPTAPVGPVEITIGKPPATPATERKWRPTPDRKPKRLPRILAYAATIVIAVVAVGGGIATTVWFFGQNEGLTPSTPSTLPVSQVPTELLSRDRVIDAPLPRSRDLLYRNMMDQMQASGGITVFVWTLNQGGTASPAAADQILSTLAWEASPAWLRSINDISLGNLGNTPFIVARVSSFDTAFGGLLAAEDNLSSDLHPLFGDILAGPPDTSTSTPAISELPRFSDDVVRNHDVRVLKDYLESERIVYGFINQNTVIITTNRAAFATIAEAIH